MSQRILVTGVSGFVGSAVGSHLRSLGYHVTGLSRGQARPGSVDLFIAHDLAKRLPRDVPPQDAIVHCAALSAPWAHPNEFHRNNVIATRNVIAHTESTRCPKLIFISSSSVYYTAGDQFDITEETPLPVTPINEYAATKRRAEQLVMESGLPYMILRPRAVFGPGDTVLFPRILRAARRGMLPRFVRSDGHSPRGDLIYIGNLAHYIERALALFCTGCFNLTNAEPVETYAFLGTVLERLHLPPIRRKLPVAAAMRLAGVLESLSRTFLGYREPPITRFGVGVLAWSKTFDVSRAIAVFGPPPISLEQGIDCFVSWQYEVWNKSESR